MFLKHLLYLNERQNYKQSSLIFIGIVDLKRGIKRIKEAYKKTVQK